MTTRLRRRLGALGCGVVMLAGCGTEAADEFGVAIDDVTGQIEVLSICSDRGLTSVAVVEAEALTDSTWFWTADHRSAGTGPSKSVVVEFADDAYRVAASGGELAPFESVFVGVLYEGTDALVPDALVVPDRIGAGEVRIPMIPETETGGVLTRAEFEDRRHRCGPPAIGTAIAVVVPLGIVASIVVIGVRSIVVRRRRRRQG